METKIIKSGMPFVIAGAAVFVFALVFGIGSVPSYILAAGLGVVGFLAGKRLFPDQVVEVEAAPKSGNAEVDALITEARGQLEDIHAANEAIADAKLSAQIEDIEKTGREILARLEEQPDMLGSLRTFLRYYLPTTKKLLDVRAGLEGDVTSGRNLQIAGRISEAVSQVQDALHRQLEALNNYRFINLESEMDVLSDMLKGDGLMAQPEQTETATVEKTEEDPFASLFERKS
ncbi:MAG: 5-bromo-4-chloroindolyl phosphate hydrolysis family protein [Clostridia bacterium]|nr:5-bromo-4-chloroindolyl phosphate hydrolysis family protein [Clostridia bacterium]